MKKILSIFLVFVSSTAVGSGGNENTFAIGLGSSYGGFLGGSYSIPFDNYRLRLSLGLLAYYADEAKVGYGVGIERQVGDTGHAVSMAIGTVYAQATNRRIAVYNGISANYNYYFSGYTENSFVLGGSLFSGKSDDSSPIFEQNKSGAFLNIGYQF